MGLEPLKRCFPEITRRETQEILGDYREHYRRTHPFLEIRLRWNLPGAVWAMDHTLEKGRGKVFSVKDLATGRQLLHQEVEDLGAERVIGELECLFESQGRPLVVKSDQGSAFKAAETESFMKRRGIFLLLSPARRPQYNGSIESRIRWLKCRTRFQTPGPGSATNAAATNRALALTNEHYCTQSKWPPIDESLRVTFARAVEETADEAAQRGLYTQRAWPRVRRNIWRHAIASALEAHGILQVWRREIPLPKKFLFAARIS